MQLKVTEMLLLGNKEDIFAYMKKIYVRSCQECVNYEVLIVHFILFSDAAQ